MGEGSIESSFQFDSYKIDYFQYKMDQFVDLLEIKQPLDPSLWNYKLRIRSPIYFQEKKYYICGIEIKLQFITEINGENDENENKEIITISSGIAGIFKVSDDRFPKDHEEMLTKIQAPALLLPYLRGAITSFIANAGFGSWVFPLINIHELAKKHAGELEIIIK